MRKAMALAMTTLLQTGATAGQEPVPEDMLRLDEVQIIGTHNSYHLRPDADLLEYLRHSGFSDGSYWTGPRLARAIDYAREPLDQQLDRGIRALELDVHDDPEGTLFLRPPLLDALARDGKAPDSLWDPSGKMRAPGFKVLHKPTYDPRSNCPLLADCLAQVADWSGAHPGHLPIILMIEVKEDPAARKLGCAGLCADGWKRLKRQLADAFGPALFRPGDVGAAWPTLGALRGKVMVMLLDDEDHARSYRAATDRDGDGDGDDLIFTAARPVKRAPFRAGPHDRIAILPDPRDPRIAAARRAGLLVYTRADADTEEARRNDPTRRNAAFDSGATFISTDFPGPDPRFSRYSVRFGAGFVRCNPVTARENCRSR
ncbi:phosphatidylinositol-specific phospholipase C domain-containing protein [Sphingomonas sp. dw_22]|uniref:phosphatidylinositol-specific phospholipase C domain-containing protein n=1 Tax=Sphingomonas sp. dw_22 TaxID=2721175 RepID=UPI001BD40126|nr:phosphatidylinositol-specific phospholipase C domain-containing protein [Sphingomonas sp. dw_22]